MAEPSIPRLNMQHGFVKSIVKNQVDRDEYDKSEKGRAFDKQQRPKERSKRREQAMYVPPHLRGSAKTSTTNEKPEDCKDQTDTSAETSEQTELQPSSSGHQDSATRIVLQLYLQMKDGSTQKLELLEGEDVKERVKKFAKETGLDERLKKALLYKVKQAMAGRST